MNTVTEVTRYAPVIGHVLTGIGAGQGAVKLTGLVGFRGQLNTETARKPIGVGRTSSGSTGPFCAEQQPPESTGGASALSSLLTSSIACNSTQVTSLPKIGGGA